MTKVVYISCMNQRPYLTLIVQFSSVQSLSRVRLFVTPCTPGFPVHHQLPELTQIHVYQVSDAIQPSHPLLPPSPLALEAAIDNAKTNRPGYVPRIFHVQNQEAG